MSIESPQNEQTPRLQIIEDVDFELVLEGDPDFESAISVVTNGKKSPEELKEDSKKEIVRTSWWLQEEWIAKGIPKEQITLKTDNLTVELYNYGQELASSQIEEAKRVISTLSQASIHEQNSRIKYITINDIDKLNDQNGEDARGWSFPASKMVSLYPRAISSEPHRIPDTSSFAGTLAHEFGHIYIHADGNFRDTWLKTFGWEDLPDDQVDLSKPAPKRYAVEQPERCITDYAQFNPDEDICESLSAVVNNPATLDVERLAFIRERWFKDEPVETGTSFERKVEGAIQMPRVPDKIKYRIKIQRFSPGTIQKYQDANAE